MIVEESGLLMDSLELLCLGLHRLLNDSEERRTEMDLVLGLRFRCLEIFLELT